jgi:hypothetical protein
MNQIGSTNDPAQEKSIFRGCLAHCEFGLPVTEGPVPGKIPTAILFANGNKYGLHIMERRNDPSFEAAIHKWEM